VKLLFDNDIGANPLSGRTTAVIGFGSQGSAHAENLRDSGLSVTVGLRAGSSSREKAFEAGFQVLGIEEAAAQADVVALLIPDEEHGETYRRHLAGSLAEGKTLLVAHGFSLHFGQVEPHPGLDVVMVAPKGPGHQVRSEFRRGRGLVMLVAVEQNFSGHARDTALQYASAIGGGRGGIFESTFRDECETDLFGEQAVICGGLTHLIAAGFETLVDAGYPPEAAYFECVHEVKLTADLIHLRGISGMRDVISNTARFGDVTRGPRVIGPEVREEMKKILSEIRSGKFAEEWMEENRSGRRVFSSLLDRQRDKPIEQVGARIRKLIHPPGRESQGIE
jgi:ketol-acid reductoisomerase